MEAKNMWQEIIVGLCVLAALLFVLQRYWPVSNKKKVACDGCTGCGDKKGCSTLPE
jgi:hypothetical protein